MLFSTFSSRFLMVSILKKPGTVWHRAVYNSACFFSLFSFFIYLFNNNICPERTQSQLRDLEKLLSERNSDDGDAP